MSDDTTDWITAAAAEAMTGRGERQIRRWAQEGKIRRRRNTAGRVVYAVADLDRVMAELIPAGDTPGAPHAAPVQELIPQTELMRLLVETQRRLEDATAQAAYARGLLDAQKLLLDDRAALQTEVARLRAELDRARRPWWKRLTGNDPAPTGRPDADPAGDDQTTG